MSQKEVILIETFNKDIKKLTNVLAALDPDNEEFLRVRELAKLAINTQPVIVVELIGPELFKYRDIIFGPNPFDFMEQVDVIDEYKKIDESVRNNPVSFSSDIQTKEFDDITKLLVLLKSKWLQLDEKEKTYILSIVKHIVRQYILYLQVQQKRK